MYWYVLIVLVCMSTCLLVLDRKLIVNIPIWCHTALESTFHAIFTVDTGEMTLQNTWYLPNTYQYIPEYCRNYCWYCVVYSSIFSPHCDRMVRGKDHGSFQPRLDHVVTFTPRRARIHPALHAVWNGAKITVLEYVLSLYLHVLQFNMYIIPTWTQYIPIQTGMYWIHTC